jgi:hypothetical protein
VIRERITPGVAGWLGGSLSPQWADTIKRQAEDVRGTMR